MCAGGKVERLVIGCMVSPVGVKGKRRETGCFDLLEDIPPQTGDRDTPVVKFTGEDKDTLAVDLETVVIPLDHFVQTIIVQWPFRGGLILSGDRSA